MGGLRNNRCPAFCGGGQKLERYRNYRSMCRVVVLQKGNNGGHRHCNIVGVGGGRLADDRVPNDDDREVWPAPSYRDGSALMVGGTMTVRGERAARAVRGSGRDEIGGERRRRRRGCEYDAMSSWMARRW